MGKYCIPDANSLKTIASTAISTFRSTFLEKFNVDKYTDYVTDLYKVWVVEAICVGVAFGWGFIFMILIRCCAGVIVWLSIFFIEACLAGGGYWAYITKDKYDVADNNYKYLQYGAYGLWGIAGLFFIVILCLCSRIRLGVAVAKVTGQFIYNTPQVLLLPPIFMIICIVWIGAWAITAVYLGSVGTIQPRAAPF